MQHSRRSTAFSRAGRAASRWRQALLALAAAACLPFLHFDSNPLNLRNPTTEGVSTFRDLMRDPETTPNTIQILAPDLGAAQALAARLNVVPEVSGTRTLADFVPKDQQPSSR